MALVNKIKTTEYGVEKNILIAPELAFTIGCIVGNSGVEVDTKTGRKIIKAGTPVGATNNVFKNRQEVLSKDAETLYGVLLHDVDVTDGDENATLVVAGYVDLLKLDADVVTVVESKETALSRILFMKGRA